MHNFYAIDYCFRYSLLFIDSLTVKNGFLYYYYDMQLPFALI